MLGDDLGQRRLKTLAVRSNAERGGDGAGRIDADDRGLGAGIDRHAGRNGDARADAGELGIAGDADADPAAGGARFFLLGAQRVVADRGAGLVQAFVKAGFVPDDAGGDLVGQLVVGDEIAQPDVLGVDAELCRRHVHQPFHDEGRDRPADAAIGAGRRFRGRHRLHAAAIILHPIGAGQEAHHLHRFERRGPRIDRIGADVADHVGAQARGCGRRRRAPIRRRRSRRTPGCWRPALPGGRWSISPGAAAAAPRRRRKFPRDRASLCRRNRRRRRRDDANLVGAAYRARATARRARCRGLALPNASVSASRVVFGEIRSAARSRPGSCDACGSGR